MGSQRSVFRVLILVSLREGEMVNLSGLEFLSSKPTVFRRASFANAGKTHTEPGSDCEER
eukprot:3555297-Amphidinium_carterae.1